MQGKQILLTGGTGGLGLGVTPVVLATGAELTLPYRKEKDLLALRETLPANALERIRFVQVDLLDETAIAQMIDSMRRVDGLIHLVGGFAMGPTHEYRLEDWRKDFDLNLTTTFLVCKHSLRKMWQQGYGRIVTVGSRGAVEPGPQLAAYCASKAGVVALTRSIAAETKGTDITANVVLPSIIDTPANRAAMGSEQAELWVKPESLGQVLAFLVSEAARDLRGAVIPVYGNV
ncbi:3-oxoacyl-ACP reductase FabG [Thermostichus vulcanus]|uniref:3-oxoacyl-ACP reductase FabG n=1 Tax=Thermostichus vulcanus str. 'Rupite' TaxID=2813851 RepID=A0ABT0CEZ2_THEVL|nr:3-oxoacyl-ACP reductase FabG [Thermostichus vulcanus]MCJ2544336.1 3-oxoacyl-ACP reductase FabG [Thermostichus vulcanus str. 'Rupite']